MKRLDTDLDGRLVDPKTGEEVKAEPLLVRPTLINFDATGIVGPYSYDEEYLSSLHQAVCREKERQRLPFESDAYLPSIEKAAGRDQGSVWVAIQHYKIVR